MGPRRHATWSKPLPWIKALPTPSYHTVRLFHVAKTNLKTSALLGSTPDNAPCVLGIDNAPCWESISRPSFLARRIQGPQRGKLVLPAFSTKKRSRFRQANITSSFSLVDWTISQFATFTHRQMSRESRDRSLFKSPRKSPYFNTPPTTLYVKQHEQ